MSIGIIALFTIVAIISTLAAIRWVSQFKHRRERNKLLVNFNEFVKENQLNLENKQTLNKNMIGIDRSQFKLVFLNGHHNPPQKILIDLRAISECRLLKIKNKSNGYISRIYLKCIYKDKNIPDLLLPFYNEKTDKLFRIMRLAKKAVYWKKTIELFREPDIRIITSSHQKGSV